MNRTNLLKGIGILLIILHNYAHWLPECVAENEYTFSLGRIRQLIAYLGNGEPHVVLNLFSHYGHYGVAIFLFLSGYGLVRKYEQQNAQSTLSVAVKCRWGLKFLCAHALKLWKLMLPALMLFVAIELWLGSWNRPWSRLLPLVGFYSNLQPHRDLILGPWWWFGLMMQFYVLWLLVIYKRGKAVLYSAISLCVAAMLIMAWLECNALDSERTVTCWLHYNFPGSMLAFGLGVAYARYDMKWLRQWWAPVVGAAIVVMGSFNAYVWTIASVGVVMCIAALMDNASQVRPAMSKQSAEGTSSGVVRRLWAQCVRPLSWHSGAEMGGACALLIWVGRISAWLFALHPVVRAYTITLARQGSEAKLYLSVALYVAISVALAWLFTCLMRKKSRIPHNNSPYN